MLLHKYLESKEVLNLLLPVIKNSIPENLQDSDAELRLEFDEDCRINIYVFSPEEENNTKN